jgi:tetratricopeptide (TPR) repeat protein
MRPYQRPHSSTPGNALFLLIIVVAFGVTRARGGSPSEKLDFDTLTRSGFRHFYSLEYAEAIRDFQSASEARPDEPKALNHLLEAELFQELYRYNALDTRLYTKQRFLTSKHVPIDPAKKKQLLDLMQRAISASDKRLKANPNDVEALYGRGVTEGLRSTYLAVVEHSFWSALHNALEARNDHEAVLRQRKDFVDAKTVVGAHEYVVGSLNTPTKVMAGIVGIRGDKNKGLRMLAEAGQGGGESNTDARVTLALFLRREERYQEAIDVVKTLTQDHPHNFLFALEQGNLLRDAGRGPESIASYRALLDGCKEGRYPNAHAEMAQFALAEALRGQNQLADALTAYQAAAKTSDYDSDLHQRALLGAAEVSDLLAQREQALAQYRAAIALDSSSEEADTARRYLDRPYRGH